MTFVVSIWNHLSDGKSNYNIWCQNMTFDVRWWHLLPEGMSNCDICCQIETFFVKLGHLLSDEMRTVKLHVNLKSVSTPALKSLSHLLKHKYLLLWVFPVTPLSLAFNTMTNILKRRFCFFYIVHRHCDCDSRNWIRVMILNFLPNSIWRKNNTSIWRQKGRPFVCRLIDMLGPLNDSNLFIKAVTTLFSAGLWRCRRKITSSSKCTFRTAPSKIVTMIMRNANYAHKSEIWRDSGNKFVLSVFFSVRPSRNKVCPVSSAHCKSSTNERGAHIRSRSDSDMDCCYLHRQ